MADYKSEVRKFITSSKMMSIATCSKNTPWISNVFYVSDEDLNLYFISSENTRHINEIIKNPKTAITIYDHASSPGGVIKGVQIEGETYECNLREVLVKFKLYLKSFPEAKTNPKLLLQLDFGTRLFKFTPKKVYYLDRKLSRKRQEVVL